MFHHRSARRLAGLAAAVAVSIVPSGGIPAGASAVATHELPPPVTFVSEHGPRGDGHIFITPSDPTGAYPSGPEILDRKGNVVWFDAIPPGQQALDFRAQTYRGQPVLTWWQGTGAGEASKGVDYIYDAQYRLMATVRAGNGLDADCHEFLITPQDTALITIYAVSTADLTSIGGPANQTVVNGVVQEIDIASGKVLFEWNSTDHVPFSESRAPLPTSPFTPWDWFHVNAAHVDTDGNLLIDARNTWSTYKVDRSDGHMIWQLGGRNSSFRVRAAPGQTLNTDGQLFAWQHDPEALGDGLYTWFDNEADGVSAARLDHSRVVTVRLDERRYVATLVDSVSQPDGLLAVSQGNAQSTLSHRLFVGWGSLPYFSQFDRSGRLVFHARFPDGVFTYRAYFLPWR